MCLGIPGRLVELNKGHAHLAQVDVSGVGRVVNVALLEHEELRPGDWVLIHVGFAMAKIDEEDAAQTLAALRLAADAYDEELSALSSSRIEPRA